MMQAFVPAEDAVFDSVPVSELIPYQIGMACYGWLSIEINPDDDLPPAEQPNQSQQSKAMARPID